MKKNYCLQAYVSTVTRINKQESRLVKFKLTAAMLISTLQAVVS